MKKKYILLFLCFLTGCCDMKHESDAYYSNIKEHNLFSKNLVYVWDDYIETQSKKYNIDANLIRAIIYSESQGNPLSIGKNNSIGLMKIQPKRAGMLVYRYLGKNIIPSFTTLLNPHNNINIGTTYLHLIQNKYLLGIKNKENLRYATIISYYIGPNTFLKIFSSNRSESIKKINSLTPIQFLLNVKKINLSVHSLKYLKKVNTVYRLFK
ncbi:transglycosylase SLT domain-containing protein [Buchnera aphidicola (Kurisakia onigurumii)]|uniref:transglycosylase SLT domain-containing protein n=1 Tax=Buchnera aphidicola TaxID=9 RepID=UPI0031B682AC